MYFLVYQTTNTINGKIYIGVHQTTNKNDGYKGSGLALRRAFKKYGRANFSTEILHKCDSKAHMFRIESELVTSEFVKRCDTYNQVVGGERGPSVDGGEYHGSEQHVQNMASARQQALIASRELKDKRIENYDRAPNLCKLCSRPLTYERRRQQFCSSSCSASYSNSRRENIWTEERKRVVSRKAKERYGETNTSRTEQRRTLWREQNQISTNHRIKQLQQFLPVKRGWVTKASHVTGIQKSWMKKWIENNIPNQFKDFYPD